MTRRAVLIGVGIWLVAALAVSASGVLTRLPFPPPAIAIGLTILALLAIRLSPHVRAGAVSLGPAPLIAFHLLRIAAGAYFLVLYNRGVLPGDFALVAGWGDVAVGVAAIPVLIWCLPVRTSAQRIGLALWNTAGLVDILVVLGNGLRLFVANPAIAEPFMSLPLTLLPTFVVPLVIASHVLLFGWVLRRVQPNGMRAGMTTRS